MAGLTGVSPATIAKILQRESAPSLPTFGALALGLGPDFVAAVFPEFGWLRVACTAMRSATLRQALDQSEAELAQTLDQLRGHR